MPAKRKANQSTTTAATAATKSRARGSKTAAAKAREVGEEGEGEGGSTLVATATTTTTTNAAAAAAAAAARSVKRARGAAAASAGGGGGGVGKRGRGLTEEEEEEEDGQEGDEEGQEEEEEEFEMDKAATTTIEQHLREQNDKFKEFLQGFKDEVAQGQDRVLGVLEQLKGQITAPSNLPSNTANSDALQEAYVVLQSDASRALSPPEDNNPLFKQTQLLLQASRDILKGYHTANKASALDSLPVELTSPRKMWQKDEEGMREVLECGRKVGEKAVEGWITPGYEKGSEGGSDDGDGDEEEEEGKREAENLAKGLFEWRKRKAAGEESWGELAKRQMGALVGLVRREQIG